MEVEDTKLRKRHFFVKICPNHCNWKVRSKRDDYPQIDWWKDGDAFVLRRNDWSDSAQHLLFEWYWIDLVQQEFLCSRAKIMAVAPRAVVSTVKSVGFDPVTTLAKWGVRPFDEDRDRGFVLVASK